MFYYLSGTVAHVEPYLAVIDCGGVGYACRTTSYTLSALKKGEKGKLFTLSERPPGRGGPVRLRHPGGAEPVSAAHLRVRRGTQGGAVHPVRQHPGQSGSVHHHRGREALTVAQGIGKKIAQRIILELKDKLAKGQTVSIQGESYGGSGITVIPENKLSEASAALAVLGYSQGEINLALKGVDLDALTLEQVIKEALKKMMKG